MVSSNKILHLLDAFSQPWFLYSNPSNHQLVFLLLEVFNNIIQYQFDGKRVWIIYSHFLCLSFSLSLVLQSGSLVVKASDFQLVSYGFEPRHVNFFLHYYLSDVIFHEICIDPICPANNCKYKILSFLLNDITNNLPA